MLLKPVLVGLGATCPTRGLFLLESEYAGGETLDSWLKLARPQVAATVKTLDSWLKVARPQVAATVKTLA